MKRGDYLVGLFALMLFLLQVGSVLALASPLEEMGLTSEKVTLGLDINSDFTIVPLSKSYSLNSLKYQLNYELDDTWQQEVSDIQTKPLAEDYGDYLLFSWPKPDSSELGFSITSSVAVENSQIKIRDKVPFPLKNLPAEVLEYTYPSQNINSDDAKIISLASELASGKDDLNAVALSLFGWVTKNIRYNRTALTEYNAQSASWVLENRYGVCDEFAALFMALSRSLGIPARYVVGAAYSNLQEVSDWQPHGWVELYFPGYGWVPFDPTYREFGYIDPTHITLRHTLDSNDSTSLISWVGSNVAIQRDSLNIDVTLLNLSGSAPPLLNLTLQPIKSEVGFGSYDLIRLRVKNPNSYYIYADISLSKVQGLTYYGEQRQQVLLKPLEAKNVFWLVRVDANLDRRYRYTFPLVASTERNTSARASLDAEKSYRLYTEAEMRNLLNELEEQESLTYSSSVDLNCTISKDTFYQDEVSLVSCTLTNQGNTYLKEIKLCLSQDCASLELPISQSLSHEFVIRPAAIGRQEASITLKNPSVSKRLDIPYNVLDTPNLTMTQLSFPQEVVFGRDYNLTFLLNKSSSSLPINVSLVVFGPRKEERLELGNLETSKEILLSLKASSLQEGPNPIRLALEYKDLSGRQYNSETNWVITLKTENIFQKLLLQLSDFSLWLESILGRI